MHRKHRSFLALLLILTAAVAARADKVDDYVKAAMLKQHIPGVSIAVVEDGKITKAEGYGLANIELNLPARPETVFKIGSVSINHGSKAQRLHESPEKPTSCLFKWARTGKNGSCWPRTKPAFSPRLVAGCSTPLPKMKRDK